MGVKHLLNRTKQFLKFSKVEMRKITILLTVYCCLKKLLKKMGRIVVQKWKITKYTFLKTLKESYRKKNHRRKKKISPIFDLQNRLLNRRQEETFYVCKEKSKFWKLVNIYNNKNTMYTPNNIESIDIMYGMKYFAMIIYLVSILLYSRGSVWICMKIYYCCLILFYTIFDEYIFR